MELKRNVYNNETLNNKCEMWQTIIDSVNLLLLLLLLLKIEEERDQ